MAQRRVVYFGGNESMPEGRFCVEGEGALGDYCPLDGSRMTVVKEEDHVSYGGDIISTSLYVKRGING